MNCPRCEELAEVIRHEDVVIDLCHRCQGMFLDKGELNAIAEQTTGDLEFCTLDGETFEHEDRYPVIRCPKCKDVKMKKVEFNIYTDIILDYCPRCEGFWLDGGELDRINDEVKRLSEASKATPRPKMLWFAEFVWRLPV